MLSCIAFYKNNSRGLSVAGRSWRHNRKLRSLITQILNCLLSTSSNLKSNLPVESNLASQYFHRVFATTLLSSSSSLSALSSSFTIHLEFAYYSITGSSTRELWGSACTLAGPNMLSTCTDVLVSQLPILESRVVKSDTRFSNK